ncbi:MAG: S8 family serine peptidase, partial [Chloroflexota bacterium]|nr:S8 family serine peptidase [Chloroflexota bacterium]
MMRSRSWPFVLAALLALSALPVQAASPGEAGSSADASETGLDATDRYIVLMAKGADTKKVRDRHIDRENLKPDRYFGKAIRGFSGKLTDEQLQALESDPDVAAVIPDEIVEIAAQTMPTGVSRIGARASQTALIDGVDERVDADVAIVDTGIDASHPDLNVVGGVNCTTADRNAWTDGHGHGTHVAGTVGAIDN